MSKYAEVEDGKVLNFSFKRQHEFLYVFRIGDIVVGQIFHMRDAWTAVPWSTPSKVGAVHGFISRRDAAEYLLKLRRASRKTT